MNVRSAASDPVRLGLRQLLLVVAGFAVCFAMIGFGVRAIEARRRSRATIAILSTLSSLEQAIEAYELDNRESPPPPDTSEILKHLRRAYRPKHLSFPLPESNSRDLSQLDASESLVLWLGGEATTLFLQRPNRIYFDFPPGKLVDSDNDGWNEYVDYSGGVFTYSDGEVFMLHPQTRRRISAEFLAEMSYR